MLRPVGIAAVLAALAPGVAHAASPFGPPVKVSPPKSALGDAEMTPDGDWAVVWQGSRNLNADPAAGKVEALISRAGVLRRVQRIASGRVREPRLGLSADGRLATTWFAPRLPIASGTLAAGFGPPVEYDIGGQYGPDGFDVNGAGAAAAVWNDSTLDTPATRVFASYRPAGGSFGPALLLAQQPAVGRPQVIVDAAGTAVVVWKGQRPGTDRSTQWAAQVSPSGAASPPVALSSPAEDARGGGIRLAANLRGDVAVSWVAATDPPPPPYQPPGPPTRPWVAVRPPGAQFGPGQLLWATTVSETPQLHLDEQGVVLAGFPDLMRRDPSIVLRRRAPDGALAAPSALRVARYFGGNLLQVGADARGNEIVAWGSASSHGFPLELLVAVRRPGEAFGPPERLHATGDPGLLLLDGRGRGVLLARDTRDESVVAFPYDAARLVAGGLVLQGVAVEPGGAAVRLRVKTEARVVVRLERAIRRRCARCASYRSLTAFTTRVRAGAHRLVLARRFGRRRLPPGAYRITLRVHDLAGRRLAQRQVRFRVARP